MRWQVALSLSALALPRRCEAFVVPTASLTTPSSSTTAIRRTSASAGNGDSSSSTQLRQTAAQGLLTQESIITPEGFGFSAPAQRVLANANRSSGYYRTNGDDLVINVMEAITSSENGQADVALVFDEQDKLLGLFTETDYIKVSGGVSSG